MHHTAARLVLPPRRMRIPAREEVQVLLRTGVAPSDLLSTLVQHVVFMHQQTPTPYLELKRNAERMEMAHNGGGKLRPLGKERKALNFLAAMKVLLDALPPAVAATRTALSTFSPDLMAQPVLFALLLGNSIATPRMVYLTRIFMPVDESGGTGSCEACRRLMRALTLQTASLGTIDPGRCRLQLLICAPPGTQLPANRFKPRPGFVLRLHRAHVATVDMTCKDEPSSHSILGNGSKADGVADVWGEGTGLVRGIKLVECRIRARRSNQNAGRLGSGQSRSEDNSILHLAHANHGEQQAAPTHATNHPCAVNQIQRALADELDGASAGSKSILDHGMADERNSVSTGGPAKLAPNMSVPSNKVHIRGNSGESNQTLIWWQSRMLIRGFRL